MIRIENCVCKLRDFSLKIELLEISSGLYFVDGPNGAGKSTLLRIVLGLIKLDSGLLVGNLGEKRGYVPQNYRASLLPWRKATANLFLHAENEAEELHLIKDLCDIGFRETDLHKFPHELSGGQCQRLAIIRECRHAEHLLVLDEPFSGLDVRTVESIGKRIRSVVDRNIPVLITSHTKLPECLNSFQNFQHLLLERVSDTDIELRLPQ